MTGTLRPLVESGSRQGALRRACFCAPLLQAYCLVVLLPYIDKPSTRAAHTRQSEAS